MLSSTRSKPLSTGILSARSRSFVTQNPSKFECLRKTAEQLRAHQTEAKAVAEHTASKLDDATRTIAILEEERAQLIVERAQLAECLKSERSAVSDLHTKLSQNEVSVQVALQMVAKLDSVVKEGMQFRDSLAIKQSEHRKAMEGFIAQREVLESTNEEITRRATEAECAQEAMKNELEVVCKQLKQAQHDTQQSNCEKERLSAILATEQEKSGALQGEMDKLLREHTRMNEQWQRDQAVLQELNTTLTNLKAKNADLAVESQQNLLRITAERDKAVLLLHTMEETHKGTVKHANNLETSIKKMEMEHSEEVQRHLKTAEDAQRECNSSHKAAIEQLESLQTEMNTKNAQEIAEMKATIMEKDKALTSLKNTLSVERKQKQKDVEGLETQMKEDMVNAVREKEEEMTRNLEETRNDLHCQLHDLNDRLQTELMQKEEARKEWHEAHVHLEKSKEEVLAIVEASQIQIRELTQKMETATATIHMQELQLKEQHDRYTTQLNEIQEKHTKELSSLHPKHANVPHDSILALKSKIATLESALKEKSKELTTFKTNTEKEMARRAERGRERASSPPPALVRANTKHNRTGNTPRTSPPEDFTALPRTLRLRKYRPIQVEPSPPVGSESDSGTGPLRHVTLKPRNTATSRGKKKKKNSGGDVFSEESVFDFVE